MASIDERVVRISFDNADFERRISATLTSLEQLNKSLKLEGASKGLADVSAEASKFNLHGIADGIEGISKKFLAMSTIAITALANITGKAVDAGLQIAKSLSLDQVIAGFQEYELKLGSIQTIMAGTGAPLDVVNQKLQELNTYSDKTIYSFADMTTNIGKFTNAGVSLDTAVASIQGVANVAALSGANSEEASRAMYNFAQALSKGYVQLVDWKSIELANMGTKEFKQQLIDAAVATGTLTKNGDEYVTSAGNAVTATKGFNESLTDQWLTTDVLNQTLGDYADNTTEIGKKAFAAAQDVKTFSQLMSTIKESIGSGWAQTFEIVIGNFDEAKSLFTSINSAVSTFVSHNADARNQLLQGWKDLGGRTLLIQSLGKAFKNLGEILAPIKKAFQDVFPPMTAQRLYDMTVAFSNFVDALKPSPATIDNLRRIFTGLFSILKIGWTIIKEGISFITGLVGALTGMAGPGVMDFFAKVGDFFTNMAKSLVDGGAIVAFFDGLKDTIKDIPGLLQYLKDKFLGLFDGFDPKVSDAVNDSMGRVHDRLQTLKDAFKKAGELWQPFEKAMKKVMDILGKIWDAISNWFKELGHNIASVMGKGDFDAVLDVINTALFGGLIGLLTAFFKKGVKIDLGGGFLDSIKQSFSELTGVLHSMQTKIKADALMKIAIAIGILTASVLVLSMIDSAALTKALGAMAIGFGQLMGAFAILNKMTVNLKSTAQFSLLAIGMGILAGAILLLSVAVRSLAGLSWEELARGLAGVTAILVILIATAKPLSERAGEMIKAGAGLTIMGVGLLILAAAVKAFSMMSLTEIGQGMAAIGVGILIIGAAMRVMPTNIALQGVGLLLIAAALNVMAMAVKSFAGLSWGEMAKGMVGVAGGLLIIAGAMQLMPSNLALTGAGLLLVGVALNFIAKAMAVMGGMSWGEIAHGLVAMAASLLILAVATTAMSGSIAGAIAIGIVSASLLLLAGVLKAFASISWGDLIHGLAAIAIALGVLAVAALLLEPAVPAILALGVALMALGAGFALIGIGAKFIAEAFMMIAKVSEKGSKAVVKTLENMGKAIPAFVRGFAEGLLELITLIGKMAPQIATMLGKLLSALLDELVKLVPKLGTLISTLLTTLFDLLREKVPEYAMLGADILIALLQGIRDRVPDLVTVVGEIVTGFLDSFGTQLDAIVQSTADLFVTYIRSVAEAIGKVSATLMVGVGQSLITGFLEGLNIDPNAIWNWFKGMLSSLINSVLSFLGIRSPSTVFMGIGADIIAGLLNGLTNAISGVASFFTGLGSRILGWVGSAANWLVSAGYAIISGLFRGIVDRWDGVKNFFSGIDSKIVSAVGNIGHALYNAGRAVIEGLWNGMKAVWNNVSSWLGGLGSKITSLKGPPKTDAKMLYGNGMLIMQGLHTGMEKEWAAIESWLSGLNPADSIDVNTNKLSTALAGLANTLDASDAFNPTITPVLDLTQVAAEASQIGSYLQTPALTSAYSTAQANTIATATTAAQKENVEDTLTGDSKVTFNQVINAPEQLSTADIYRQTRNQITLAKEELKIP